jgi:hypothetical protein
LHNGRQKNKAGIEVTKMAEFTSEPQKAFSPVRLYILGIVIVLMGASLLVFHYYGGSRPAKRGGSSVVVPGLLRSGNTNFEYYKTRIKVENVKAILGISFNNTRTAMISGVILNDGDRKLEAVEMHVTLYDVWGKVSKEKTAFALRPGVGISGSPLEPLEKRQFTIGVESIEYYWNPKQITYEITGLKYQ